MFRERRIYRNKTASTLKTLAGRGINYQPPAGVPDPADGWHVDAVRCTLPQEPPGDPVSGGSWDTARRLVHDYQFAEPAILRALYDGDEELLGRNMLLEGRFFGLRFDMGVRVTSVLDEIREEDGGTQRVWGWGYQTLQGHLEQGELFYEVIKYLQTGTVEFLITGYSRRAPIGSSVVRAGFFFFGRPTQRRFYRASLRRMHRLVRAELNGMPPVPQEKVPGRDNLIVAPTHRGDPVLRPRRLSSGSRRGTFP